MSQLKRILEKQASTFHPVVPFDPKVHKLIAIDLTAANESLTEFMVNDTALFSKYIFDILASKKALYGIGGYNEQRSVYSRSRVFDAVNEGAEPRRLHLGTDIWGRPHTAVSAPLDGVVHSFAYNEGYGNYGTTIILTHKLEGVIFHTLYGHLSRSSVVNLSEGANIEKGDVFAEFGIPSENGEWPPHLHFQIIIDLEGWSGDYPGVCKFSEREAYLQNCPDPDLILQMNRYISKD